MDERYQVIINREQIAAVILFLQAHCLNGMNFNSDDEDNKEITEHLGHTVGTIQAFLENCWEQIGNDEIKVEFKKPIIDNNIEMSSKLEEAMSNLDYKQVNSDD